MTPEILPIAEQKFHDFLASHNHPLDGAINHDSKNFHPYKCPHGNSTDARYKFFSDGVASGYFKCWKCGIEGDFCSKQEHEVSPEKWQAHIKRIAECKCQNKQETQQKHIEAATLARAIFEVATEEDASDHPYLQLKHARNYGLRVLTSEDANTKKANCYPGTLLIPAHDSNNKLVNLERIYHGKKANKFEKRPLCGGQRIGAYSMLGNVTEPVDIILIAEGYSTAATLHEATGYPTAVTFNCGNIPHVAKVLSKKYPQARLVIIADDDKWHDDPKLRHAGLKAAKKTSGSIKNAKYVLPDFSVLEWPDEKLAESKPTDMNDLFVLLLAQGLDRTAALDTVRQQIQQHFDEVIMTEDVKEKKVSQQSGKDEPPKAAEVLLQLVDEGEFEFFHDDHQDAFCKYPSQKSNVYEARRLNDSKFKSYLSFIYRQEAGKTIGEASLKEAIAEMEGRALHDKSSKKEKVFIRVGELNEKIYIDLCNDKWEAIEVSPTGWKILNSKDVPVRFERSQHSLPLPDPSSVDSGDISKLWDIVNIPEDNQILVLAYILECFRNTTAFPILVLLGLQDSGKSATQNTLRSLIDPSSSNLRTAPRKVDDLVTEAASNWLVSYNNVSGISDEMHDDFCCIATGSGFATRKFYTNTQQIVINIARPVVINGIFNFIRRPDLLDRAIILELDSIDESKRKTDAELNKAMHTNLPIIFRGLLDLLVRVLTELPNVTLDKQPRMADFALLGVATERALGLERGSFIKCYRANRADAKENILDSSPVMLALVEFIDMQPNKSWRDTPTKLLEALTKLKEPSIHTLWPKSAQAMGAELRRYFASLKGVGIEVINESKLSGRKNREGNIYRISRIPVAKSDDAKRSPQCPPSPHSNTEPNNHGASERLDSVDMGVDIMESMPAMSTRSPHSKNLANPRGIDVSERQVDIVDIVDFKTDHTTLQAPNDDSVAV